MMIENLIGNKSRRKIKKIKQKFDIFIMTKNIFNPTHKTGFFLDLFFFNLSTIPLSSLNLGKFFYFCSRDRKSRS